MDRTRRWTKDRVKYLQTRCSTKRLFLDYESATANKGQFVYWCRHCQGFHRTSYPVSSRVQLEAEDHAKRLASAVHKNTQISAPQ